MVFLFFPRIITANLFLKILADLPAADYEDYSVVFFKKIFCGTYNYGNNSKNNYKEGCLKFMLFDVDLRVMRWRCELI